MKQVEHQLNVYLTREQIKKLKEERKKTGCSMGSIIRLALEEYFYKKGVTQ